MHVNVTYKDGRNRDNNDGNELSRCNAFETRRQDGRAAFDHDAADAVLSCDACGGTHELVRAVASDGKILFDTPTHEMHNEDQRERGRQLQVQSRFQQL